MSPILEASMNSGTLHADTAHDWVYVASRFAKNWSCLIETRFFGDRRLANRAMYAATALTTASASVKEIDADLTELNASRILCASSIMTMLPLMSIPRDSLVFSCMRDAYGTRTTSAILSTFLDA